MITLLKSDVLTRDIHVIITATATEKEQAFTKQADSFLSLPIKEQSLISLLEKISITTEFKHSGI